MSSPILACRTLASLTEKVYAFAPFHTERVYTFVHSIQKRFTDYSIPLIIFIRYGYEHENSTSVERDECMNNLVA